MAATITTRFRAVLWDYPEGRPGGGGPDSPLTYDELPKTTWCDSREAASTAGEELNRAFDYDWFVRIEAEDYAA